MVLSQVALEIADLSKRQVAIETSAILESEKTSVPLQEKDPKNDHWVFGISDLTHGILTLNCLILLNASSSRLDNNAVFL